MSFGFSHSFPLVTFPVTLKFYDRFGPEMHHLLKQSRSSHHSDSHHSHSEYDEVSIIESSAF